MKSPIKQLPGLLLGFGLLFAPGLAMAAATEVLVHKSPYCGCCSAWVEHMEAAGFEVTVQDHMNMDPIKREHGIRPQLASCHTALVDGYVIEGHVPADDIKRLLAERPDVAGLAVPGMPVGSPGMEMGDKKDPYDVVAFDNQGGVQVYSEHNK